MKKAWLIAAFVVVAVPAHAQFGGLGGALKKAQDAVTGLRISEADERALGEDVSLKIRQRFGVVQNAAVHKYVSLMGMTLAAASDRPNLPWTFVVLDTDGVNAFAAPGGIVHITRGALAMIKDEAELATVLGHEIGHVTSKHTVNAIQKSNAIKMGTDATMKNEAVRSAVFKLGYEQVIENKFDRNQEMEADQVGVGLAQKVGYGPGALGDFLSRLADRNKEATESNGLFASHPDTAARIAKIKQLSSTSKAVALGEPRYKSNITYEPVPIAAIATTTDAAAAAASQAPAQKTNALDSLKKNVSGDKESTQVSASGGARGLGRDRAAKGGDNATLVKTSVSAAELEAFKKGIA
jgi:predicted Zn-dependent protease